VLNSWWSEFECVVVVMHGISPWMLGEEERLSKDLTGHSSGRQSDGCGRVVRSGDNDNLSCGESKFLRKRNPKKSKEWMRRQIMRLPSPFMGRRREGRWYSGGEMIDSE
jgi:hypothetical protein